MRRAGIVSIADEVLLEWLQFQGGRIIGVRASPFRPGVVELAIEHADMPNADEGVSLLDVIVDYQTVRHSKKYPLGMKRISPSRQMGEEA